ncbi:uncharacterized protein LOC134359622 isoform X1 [Mobula hypostoma]|uniref:uncharacterized protein LOC134359622 isoform X1 n=1 Tax=Mobula hypostoma TaxID=723540 RepID=UPI002FC39823
MFRFLRTAIQTRNINSLLSVFCVWNLLYSTCETSDPCVQAEHNKYFCTLIPHASWYPSNIKLLLFKVESGIGSINYTTFNSSRLTSVSNLTITDSGVTSIAQGAFSSFRRLVVLILNNNKLSTISASWFASPASLVKLSLFRNRIHTIDVTSLSNLSNLVELNLSQNAISDIADQGFRSNLKLSILDLSTNNLTFLRTETFAGLHLKKLGLQDNPWICSCELADFANFLGDLVNKSAVDGYSITCHDPPNLQGSPVWNVSDFGCKISAYTTWPSQHVASENLFPKLLWLLGLLFILLLLVIPLLKRKQEKKQTVPERQTDNKQENGLQMEDPTGKSNFEMQAVNSLTGVEVNKIHKSSQIAGVQLANEIPPKDLPELPWRDQEISDIRAATSQLFTENSERIKNERGTSKQEKATCDDDSSLENQTAGVLDYGTVSGSKSLSMSPFQNQGGPDLTQREKKGNGKPVGMIIPLSKMTTGNTVNPDENLALTTSVVSGKQAVVTSSLKGDKLIKGDAGEIYDSRRLMNSVKQHGKGSEMPEKNESQGNIAQIETRVLGGRSKESSLRNDENILKYSSGVGSPTSLRRGGISTTESVRRGQLSCEVVILPGSVCAPATPDNETVADAGSSTKDNPWGSDYGYANLLHEIVENQGRRTRERWKQSHRFKMAHQV